MSKVSNLFFVMGIAFFSLSIMQIMNIVEVSSINISSTFMIAFIAFVIWSLISTGNKHLPYWLTIILGSFLLFLSFKQPENSRLAKITGIIHINDLSLSISGILIIIWSQVISRKSFFNAKKYYSSLFIILILLIFGMNVMIPGDSHENISYAEYHKTLISMLHPNAEEYIDDLDSKIIEVIEDDTLSKKEKEEAIQDLNQRIIDLESELALYHELMHENQEYIKEIANLKQQLTNIQTQSSININEIEPVRTLREAIKPDNIIVRDFAVALASEYPGSYYSTNSFSSFPSISSVGIHQVVILHSFISSSWNYINDPLYIDHDYYSPADRTILLNLAGDCDDYAILISSVIEAIGGRTRILGGTCAEGGHAWPEVFIGNKSDWDNALSIINEYYPGIVVEYLISRDNEYWLSLDWNLGKHTCSNNPEILYQSEYK